MTTERAAESATVSADALHAFCVTALTKVGVSDADARTTADVLVTTDTWGVFTHGVKALAATCGVCGPADSARTPGRRSSPPARPGPWWTVIRRWAW